jgi:ribosomal protein S18 acetylase RimI-like enzyme
MQVWVVCMTSQQAISFRCATRQDYDFAWRLYSRTIREITEALIGWNEIKQSASFADQWRPEEVRVIVTAGTDIGWLQTALVSDTMFIKQMYIDPAYQRMGIGTRVMGIVIAEASKEQLPVALAVMKNNPAQRLYSRLGFLITHTDRYKFYMQRNPLVGG